MPTVTLGRTNITVDKNGFGALPIQRVSDRKEATRLLHMALDAGITYFDTARGYTDSEEKLGEAFGGCRDKVILATKTLSHEPKIFWEHLETSLRLLKTDYIDIYQFHNPAKCYAPGDGTGMYEAMLQAQQQGKIRFIGLTNHRSWVAEEGVRSGHYDTLQFPFAYLADEKDEALVRLCAEKNVGFVCMKGMAGGLISDSRAAYAYIAQFPNALPIWGVQSEKELLEFISYIHTPPQLNEELRAVIEQDKKELSGSFCRACGYCLPCPAGIRITECARMDLLTRRAALGAFRDEASQAMMQQINSCTNCRQCASKCPYGLDTPALLKENLRLYETYLASSRL